MDRHQFGVAHVVDNEWEINSKCTLGTFSRVLQMNYTLQKQPKTNRAYKREAGLHIVENERT